MTVSGTRIKADKNLSHIMPSLIIRSEVSIIPGSVTVMNSSAKGSFIELELGPQLDNYVIFHCTDRRYRHYCYINVEYDIPLDVILIISVLNVFFVTVVFISYLVCHIGT